MLISLFMKQWRHCRWKWTCIELKLKTFYQTNRTQAAKISPRQRQNGPVGWVIWQVKTHSQCDL